MWIKIVSVMFLHVAIQSQDHDGVTNQLLFARPDAKGNKYAISFSTDKPLPASFKKWFKAEAHMECQSFNSNNPGAHVCNASKIIVDGKTYMVSDKRKPYDRQSDKSFGEERAVTRKER